MSSQIQTIEPALHLKTWDSLCALKDAFAPRARSLLAIILPSFAVLSASGAVSPYVTPRHVLCYIAVWIAGLMAVVSSSLSRKVKIGVVWAGSLVVALAIKSATDTLLWPFALALVWGALGLLPAPLAGTYRRVALALLLFGFGFYLLPSSFPTFQYAIEVALPHCIRWLIGLVLSEPPLLTADTIGIPGLMWATALAASSLVNGHPVRQATFAYLGAWIFAIVGISAVIVPGLMRTGDSKLLFPLYAGMFPMIGSLALEAFGNGTPSSIRVKFTFAALSPKVSALCLACGAAFGAFLMASALTRADDPTVLVLNEGGFDWDVPQHGKYGAFSTGMFGMIPYYYPKVSVCVGSDLQEALGKRPGVFLLLNCGRVWSKEDRAAVFHYVENGGSLLVLGDHTDVFGVMRGYNSLLEPLGITFKYDSAYPESGRITGSVRKEFSGLGHRVSLDDNNGIGIGASLAVAPPARAILTLRHGFSDHGEPKNIMGSYLGNYRYDVGEQYGGSCVIAGGTLGKGRYVVFGDTSGFQNSGMAHSARALFIPLLRYLSSPLTLLEGLVGCIQLVACGILLAPWPRVPWKGMLLAVGATVCVAYAVPYALLPESVYTHPQAALIDKTCFPRIGHYEARRNPIGPLYTALKRAGAVPYDLEEWDSQLVEKARALFVIEPTLPPSRRRTAELQSFVEKGGTLVLAAGPEGGKVYKDLLDRFGVEILNTPLGSLPPRAKEEEIAELAAVQGISKSVRPVTHSAPTMLSAWAIRLQNTTRAEILYEAMGVPVAIAIDSGKGTLVVIADDRFFSDENVEGRWGHSGATIRWIAFLFNKYLGGTFSGFARPFENPPTP